MPNIQYARYIRFGKVRASTLVHDLLEIFFSSSPTVFTKHTISNTPFPNPLTTFIFRKVWTTTYPLQTGLESSFQAHLLSGPVWVSGCFCVYFAEIFLFFFLLNLSRKVGRNVSKRAWTCAEVLRLPLATGLWFHERPPRA